MAVTVAKVNEQVLSLEMQAFICLRLLLVRFGQRLSFRHHFSGCFWTKSKFPSIMNWHDRSHQLPFYSRQSGGDLNKCAWSFASHSYLQVRLGFKAFTTSNNDSGNPIASDAQSSFSNTKVASYVSQYINYRQSTTGLRLTVKCQWGFKI